MPAFSKVSVLVPTRQRPERLRRMLDSYEATARRGIGPHTELLLRTDDDDAVTRDFLRANPHTTRVLTGSRHNGYASLSLFFNELAAAATGDVLMLGNDDMVFKTPDWPARILEAANQYPDGLFDIGYRTHNATHYPFATISRRVVEHLGFFWPPQIFWGDIFWRDVMGAFGRTVMLDDVEIAHEWVGFDAEPDTVFREANKVEPAGYWDGAHADAVSETVAKLRELLRARDVNEEPCTFPRCPCPCGVCLSNPVGH
jgi:hypothetical protein